MKDILWKQYISLPLLWYSKSRFETEKKALESSRSFFDVRRKWPPLFVPGTSQKNSKSIKAEWGEYPQHCALRSPYPLSELWTHLALSFLTQLYSLLDKVGRTQCSGESIFWWCCLLCSLMFFVLRPSKATMFCHSLLRMLAGQDSLEDKLRALLSPLGTEH